MARRRLGGISLIEVDGVCVGMIQRFDRPGTVEVGEIQVAPSHQRRGIGPAVLQDLIAQAHRQGQTVRLSVGLKNDRALRLYQRLGFRQVEQTETHQHLACEPEG